MLVLSRENVQTLASMPKAIELVKVAFAELSEGRALTPLRLSLAVNAESATSLVMAAYVPAAAALGVKVVSVFGRNADRGLPTIASLVTMIDDETGQPLAIMDGAYLTALRTGAVSGAATDLLAREDSKVVTVIGAGAQALTQAAAVCAVRPIERVIVTARSRASLDRFRERLSEDWPDLVNRLETSLDTPAAVRDADIVCTATSSPTPVFEDADLQPGTHINGVGSFTPRMREIPSRTVARALVVVDQLEPALAEAGDLLIPLREGLIRRDHISRELGHLVTRKVGGRTSDDEITFFKSVGNAVQDVVVGRFVYDEAIRRQVGQSVDL
ncbi:MAG: ornithine cyclodeaminase [Chloroflexia bacterium]|nr:ornithine cyclodeaminase [Chloroflexia bacterium]